MQSYRIHLVRCGYTENTKKGIYEGKTPDDPICDESLLQIRKMAEDYDYPSVNTVFIPNHERCFDTYMLLWPEAKYVKMDAFSEMSFGEFEGKTAEELADDKVYKDWLKGNAEFAPPGGENGREFSERICSAFVKIVDAMMSSGTTDIALIAPGGVIMTICRFFAYPELEMTEWLTPPGCGYTLRTDQTLWGNTGKCEAYAEIPYPPEDEQYDD